MADDIKTAPVDLGVSAPVDTPAPTQTPTQPPITAGKADVNAMNTDLADLSPVAGTEKAIAPNSTDDLTPVEGTDKNLAGSAASRFMDRIKANAKGMTLGMYHAFADPATETELRQLKEKSEAERARQKDLWKNHPELTPDVPDLSLDPSRVTLAWHRLIDAPADELQNKSFDEAANAKELWQQGHRWKAVNAYSNASADTALAAIPMMGPFINDIAERAEKGDLAGAAGDLTFAIAAEHAPGKVLDLVKGDARLLAEAQKNHARARTQYDLRASEADAATDSVRQAAAELQKTKDAVARGEAQPSELHEVQSRASEAASNLRKANEALKDAQETRGNAVFEEKRMARRVAEKQNKVAAAEAEKFKSQAQSSKDLIQKAVPAKGTDFYEPDESGHSSYDVVRAHLDAAKEAGQPVDTIADSRNAVENARQEIEDKVMQYRQKYADEPLTDQANSPKNTVTQKLQEMAKVDGNFDDAEDYLNDFNVTDPTVGEGADLLTKLNDHIRQMKKSSNNWDIYNQIQTNPKFAAYYFLADALRDRLYDKFESKGIQGIREARGETAALIDFRNMADAQIKRNAGGSKVRGSASGGKLTQLIGRFTKKAVKGGTVMAGAKLGGPEGAVIGYGIGEELGQAAENAISPQDMTRDEHISQAMKTKGTKYKPVEIKGVGTEPVVPRDAVAPAVKDVPQALELTQRENTDLHAELAAHFDVTDTKENSYQELEDRFRQEYEDKKEAGIIPTAGEKTLLKKILQADVADDGIRKQAESASKTPNPEDEAKILAAAKARAEGNAPPGANPTLMKLGRGDESALVSHSPAAKAHAPAMSISGLGEGITSDDVHLHEWAHVAADAVDHTGGEEGPTALEIRSDQHPKSSPGSGATSVFDASDVKDANGDVDPEKLQTQIVKWLTNKMAGPASHEVFRGMTKEEAMNHPATRSDIREARAIIRQVDPDLTPKQVEEQVDAAYERMRQFLSQRHIADRIRANAAVREEGLPETLHASRGRVEQFQRDILEAHNEHEGTEGPEPNGGPSGEGGKKAEQPAEGEEKNAGGKKGGGKPAPRADNEPVEAADGVAESKVSKTAEEPELRVPYKEGRTNPPERSTGKYDKAIKAGGAIPGGIQEGDPEINLPDLALFHDPTTGSTLALKAADVTAEAVKQQLQKSRAQYLKANPAESRIPKAGQPGYDEAIHGDIGESKINHDDVLDNIKRAYGVHDDPKLENQAGFITPDARHIDLPSSIMHSDAIEDAGGEKSVGSKDNRSNFINETGTIRVHKARERAGNVLAFSVPKDGVTAEQAEAMARSFGANGDRNGVLRIERADVNAKNKATASTEKDFPRQSDVKPMLRKIGALEESKIEKTTEDQLAEHEKNGGSTFTPEGENLSGADTHAVGSYPERGITVDKLTPEVLNKFKADNADLLSQGNHAVGTWKDPDTGKTALDISKTIEDRDEAIKAGQDANQKAIYNLKTGETIPTGGTGEVPEIGESAIKKSPKGSSVPLMENPLEVKPGKGREDVNTLDITKALNQYSKKQLPALEPGSEPKEMVARAAKIAEDEAKYQLAQSKTGTEWYTTEMKDHDKVLQSLRPELAEGQTVDSPLAPGHPVNLTLFKAAEGILSSGQKPYANVKSAVKAWDLYKETGEFPPVNPATGKSWGPRSVEAYGNAFEGVNKLIQEKGEKGAANWLLSDHPVSELKQYNKNVSGKKTDMATGAMILGEKRGPFMQNLHGIESKFTADMWVSRTWNRWMGTLDLDPRIEAKGKVTSESDAPRNNTERSLMKESFSKTADKLGLTTSSLQAVLWYYEQALYRAHGVPVESWSFSDAAKRVSKEAGAAPEAEQTGFNYGANEGKSSTEAGGLSALSGVKTKTPGAVNVAQFLNALKK